MSDTKLIQAVLDKVTSVDNKVDRVEKQVVENGKRIDRLGTQLAELDDDAPTSEEFNKLERRVSKVEKQATSN